MGRSPCCEKVGLKKGPWTPEEDQKLLAYIEEYGHGSWRALPAKAGLQRCGKSCRLRWTNYLRPDIKRGKFSLQEEQTIIQLHALLGNRWSAIATHLNKRTDNEIKNYWNTHLKKRLTKMGIDPVTHKPRSDTLSCAAAASGGAAATKSAATLSHMAQWESARLEAEARLARESKIREAAAAASSGVPPNNGAVQAVGSNQMSTAAASCLDVLRAWQQGGATAAAATGWASSKARSHDMLCASTTGGAGRMIDLQQEQSPTSTLSFSESAMPNMVRLGSFSAEHAATSAISGTTSGDHQYEADKATAGWRCFGRSMRLLDYAKDDTDHAPQDQLSNTSHPPPASHHLQGFPNLEEPQPLAFSSSDTALPWLNQVNLLKQQTSSASTSSGVGNHHNCGFGDGFTEMLFLDRSHDDSSSGHSDNDVGAPAPRHHVHSDHDENKISYWDSILNLVNSSASSPSSSPTLF